MLKSIIIIGSVNLPKKSKISHNFRPTSAPVYETTHSTGFLSSLNNNFSNSFIFFLPGLNPYAQSLEKIQDLRRDQASYVYQTLGLQQSASSNNSNGKNFKTGNFVCFQTKIMVLNILNSSYDFISILT